MYTSTLKKKISNIFSGIYYSIFKNAFVEMIARRRLMICEPCTYFDKIGTGCIVPGSQPCCEICGCRMEWKARSMESRCDKGRWEAETIPEIVPA